MKKVILGLMVLGSVAFADTSLKIESGNKSGVSIGVEYSAEVKENVIFNTSSTFGLEEERNKAKIGLGYITEYGLLKGGLEIEALANKYFVGFEKDYKDFVFGVEYSKNVNTEEIYMNAYKFSAEYIVDKNINIFTTYEVEKIKIIEEKTEANLSFGVKYKF